VFVIEIYTPPSRRKRERIFKFCQAAVRRKYSRCGKMLKPKKQRKKEKHYTYIDKGVLWLDILKKD
jgi:hypothetical protein